MNGLILTAGGARGAYQAGVLKRVGEMPALKHRPLPFPIITGASAGAINGAGLAAGASDFTETTRRLADLWANIKMSEVFRFDLVSLGGIAAQWIKDLSFGGLVGGGTAESLLDATPLRDLLLKHIPFDQIQAGIDHGHLFALAVTATNYYSGKSYTFIQGKEGHARWERSRRLALSVRIEVEHILASAAIPLVFPPVKVRADFGDYYYGDGALRLTNPCSPAIRLGAERIFAIGIRSQETAEVSSRGALSQSRDPEAPPVMRRPPVLAQILGVTLNAIFLDHLDADLDHLVRMNELIANATFGTTDGARMRVVAPLAIYPSVDLGKLAEDFSAGLPLPVRYLLDGLGASRSDSSDLMSYLMFDPGYTRALLDIGYRDASARADEIEAFLKAGLQRS